MPIYEIEGPDGKIYEVEGPAQDKPQPTTPTSIGKEMLKVLSTGAYEGATSLPRFVRDAGNWLEEKFPTPEWTKVPVPGGKAVAAADEAVRGAIRPDTPAGKTTANILGAGVGAVAGPGGMAAPVRSFITGLSAGGGSEAAAKLFGDSAFSRVLGGLAGGGTAALAQSLPTSANSLIKQSTKGMTDADWRRAQAIEQVLEAQSVPHLKSQLLGPASSLDDVVAQASSSPAARPTLLKAVRNVATDANKALERWKLQNLPISVDERRGVMQDLQGVAKQADVDAVKRANTAFEQAMPAPGGTYSPQYVETLKQELRDLASSTKYGPTSVGGKALLRFADEHLTLPPGQAMPIEHLNNLLKDLNALGKTEGWQGLPQADLKKVLKSYTPEFEAARDAKRAIMQSEVNPMREGLAGQIMQMGGGVREGKYTATGDTIKLVFPVDKPQPEAIRKLAIDIGGEQVGSLLREHLTRSFEAAAKGLSELQHSPADFVKAIAGTPAQRANLEAALTVTAKDSGANPAAVRNGFYELMKAFGTYKDLKLSGGVSGASTQFAAGQSVPGAVIAPQSRIARYMWEKASAKTYQKIAEMVTSPEGLKQLERIARTPEPRLKAALVRGVVAGAVEEGENSPDVNQQ